MARVLFDYKEEAKKRILEIASQKMLEIGYQKLKMEDISNEAGISRSTLYLYFKNKDELVFEILSKIITDICEVAESSINNSLEGTDGGFFDYITIKYQDYFTIFAEVGAVVKQDDYEIITPFGRLHEVMVEQIAQHIENKYPEFTKKEKDSVIVADALLSLFMGLQTRIKLGMNNEQARVIWNTVVSSLIKP